MIEHDRRHEDDQEGPVDSEPPPGRYPRIQRINALSREPVPVPARLASATMSPTPVSIATLCDSHAAASHRSHR